MVTQKFDINMIPGKPKPIIRASQYDTGLRAFEVSLFAGTEVYTIPSGATLTVQGTKPDYTGFSYAATYSGNTVSFDCTDQMTACAGAVEVEIVVVNEGERVATANFVLQVEPAALKDDTIISETDIPIIEKLPEMMEDMDKLISTFGGPNVANTAAEMTDQDKVYVYIGSESGYNSGHWYYYDKTAHVWKDGGIYQSAGMDLDTTLSVSGKAADAKAVGDALALKANLASPTFTGCPKAPTASLLSYNTQIANTEFVQRLVMPLDDAVNGLEPTEVPMHLVVDGTTGTWEQGGKTYTYDLLPGDEVKVTAGERDAYLVWYTIRGGSTAVDVSTSHTLTAGSTRQWGTIYARTLAVLMEDASGNDVSPAVFTINGIEKGLTERVDALETTTDEAKAIALKAFATPTASGSLLALTDGADGIPAKKLTLNLAPHQSGSGDPSPENVRPISGYQSVKLYRTGKNMLDPSLCVERTQGGVTRKVNADGTITLTGTPTQTSVFWKPTDGMNIPIKAGTYAVTTFNSKCVLRLALKKAASTTSNVFTLTEDDEILNVRFVLATTGEELNDVVSPMLVSGGTIPTDFAPYQGETYDITLPTEAGTVYGGSLTVNDDGSGSLTVDRAIKDASEGYFNPISAEKPHIALGVANTFPNIKIPASNNNVADAVSNKYKVAAYLGSNGLYNYTGTDALFSITNTGRVAVYDSTQDFSAMTPEAIGAYLTGTKFCYPLAVPQIYTLTASQVTTLLGDNTLWMDADGSIDLQYRADTEKYVERRIAEVQALVLENNG